VTAIVQTSRSTIQRACAILCTVGPNLIIASERYQKLLERNSRQTSGWRSESIIH
jgi:hypothetical protein